MAISLADRALDGPIPGENFTSDSRNYPWHRPPEFSDLDKAVEWSFKKLTDEDSAFNLLTMVEMGTDIATITDIFVTAGIENGKWAPDFAILMAGPIAHIVYLMAKSYGLDCDLGIDTKTRAPTAAFFKGMKKIDEQRAKAAAASVNLDQIETTTAPMAPQPQPAPMVGGFGGMSLDEGMGV